MGREAHALVQAMAGSLPREKRADAIRACRRRIAVALRTGIANDIHTAGKPLALSADVSYTTGRPRTWPVGWLAPVTEEMADEDMPTVEDADMSAEGRPVAAAGG